MLSDIVLSGYLFYLLTVVFSFCSAVVVAAVSFQKKKSQSSGGIMFGSWLGF